MITFSPQLVSHSIVFFTFLFSCFPAWSQHVIVHENVHFESAHSGNGILIAAPHAASDKYTGKIALGIARILGAGYLVVTARGDTIRRTNVNRPSEKERFGSAEIWTDRSESVYLRYLDLIRSSSNMPLRAYIEIHGHGDHRLRNVVEVASIGLTSNQANRMKDAFESAYEDGAGYLARNMGLVVRVEPTDRLRYQASASKRIGVLSERISTLSLHVELPTMARELRSSAVTESLIAAMVRAVVSY